MKFHWDWCLENKNLVVSNVIVPSYLYTDASTKIISRFLNKFLCFFKLSLQNLTMAIAGKKWQNEGLTRTCQIFSDKIPDDKRDLSNKDLHQLEMYFKSKEKTNVNQANSNHLLPPLIKRDVRVNPAWNHMLNENLAKKCSATPQPKKADSFFACTSNSLRKFCKIAKEDSDSNERSSREVSLEEIDETKSGVPDRYINLRKNFGKSKLALTPVKSSTFMRQFRKSLHESPWVFGSS